MAEPSRVSWLLRQVPPREFAARLRLVALRRLGRRWRPKAPEDLKTSRVFRTLADTQGLRAAFLGAGLAQATVEEAEKVLRGEFTLFGRLAHKAPGGIPDWLAALPEGDRWPGEFSFDIELPAANGADVRFTWELSRHGDLTALARAAFLTGEGRFSLRLESLLDDWMRANPVLSGPNWMSALEAAVRGIAWAFIDDAAGERLGDEVKRRFSKMLFLHGLYVERYMSAGLNPSNHIIGEAAGLYVLGGKFAATDEGRRWRGRGRRILADEIMRQTFECGASREQSIAYHRFVTGLFGLCLAVGGDEDFSAQYRGRLLEMYRFLVAVARPDGSFPNFGDGDDAAALRLSAPKPNDLRDDISLGAALFPHGGLGAPTLSPQALWLLGAATAHGKAGGKARRTSAVFSGAGLAVLCGGDGKLQVEFDAGPQGYTPVSGHGHADALSVTLWHGGERLKDSGTYRYNGADTWRDAFRSTPFHNTVTVDNRSQAVPASPFRWLTLADARVEASFLSEDFDWVKGKLDAGPARPWSHTREVIRIGSQIIIVVDSIESRGEHTAQAYFHCGSARIETKGRRAKAVYEDDSVLSIFAVKREARFEKVAHSVLTAPAWESAFHGEKQPSSTVVAEVDFEDEALLPWVISLDGDAVKRTPAATHGGMAVEMADGARRYLFVVLPKTDVTHVGGLKFVGRWAVVERDGAQFTRAWAADAWALEYGGTRLLSQIGGVKLALVTP